MFPIKLNRVYQVYSLDLDSILILQLFLCLKQIFNNPNMYYITKNNYLYGRYPMGNYNGCFIDHDLIQLFLNNLFIL